MSAPEKQIPGAMRAECAAPGSLCVSVWAGTRSGHYEGSWLRFATSLESLTLTVLKVKTSPLPALATSTTNSRQMAYLY